MKKRLLFIALCCLPFSVFCQRQADNWFFGVFAGISFAGGSPVVISSNNTLNTTEGCSSISDSLGNLLFYTDGITVWNKQLTQMPNGTGLMGGVSSTQSGLIVPLPGNDSTYYLFTCAEDGGTDGFRYSIVDMRQDSGRGDVVSKNNLILANSTERQTAIRNDLNGNYWITMHEWGTNAFYTYPLTAAGLQAPVISHTGIVHNYSKIQNTYGQLKFSSCGGRIAGAFGYLDTVQVFDFDMTTGIISNPITIAMPDHVYGLEFSSDGSKMYVSCYEPSPTLVQFDLSTGDSATIVASAVPLSQTADIYGMQMGPDRKIYVNRSFSQFLGVINNPDLAGTACDYQDNGIDLDPNFFGTTSGVGLPGFVQSIFHSPESFCFVSVGVNNQVIKNRPAIYPNPSSENFTLNLSVFPSASEIIVHDVSGKIVEVYSNLPFNGEISFGKNLTAGVYSVSVKSNTSINTMMIVKAANGF